MSINLANLILLVTMHCLWSECPSDFTVIKPMYITDNTIVDIKT